MFSLQQLFGKGDKFFELLDDAAEEAHEGVRIAIEIVNSRDNQKLADLVLVRRKGKKIAEQISEDLVRSFVTGLEREDIEMVARMLYKIPKSAEKLAERVLMAGQNVDGIDFSSQTGMMIKATDVVLSMIRQLRYMEDLEKLKNFNDELQRIEGEADKLMMSLLSELYSGKYEALRAMVIRDLYELMEKVIDRCRDVGNVVMNIVLKNS